MKITYQTIGQRCCAETKKGTRCRLPASTIAGGLAVCPYHIRQAVDLFRRVSTNPANAEYADLFQHAAQDSQIV